MNGVKTEHAVPPFNWFSVSMSSLILYTFASPKLFVSKTITVINYSYPINPIAPGKMGPYIIQLLSLFIVKITCKFCMTVKYSSVLTP